MKKQSTLERYTEYFLQENWGDFLLSQIDPTLAWKRVKARVEEIRLETEDTKTIQLIPNLNWKGFLAGQHVGITVSVDGKRHTRYYSLTSQKDPRALEITVKLQPHGLVSGYIHNKLKVGDIIEISEASGDFTLGSSSDSLLFLAGGSGITPIYSILRELSASKDPRSIVLIYFSQKSENIIFYDKLNFLKETISGLKIYHILTHDSKEGFGSGFLSKELLEYYCPDFKNRRAFVCGPDSLKESAKSLLPTEKMKTENFFLGSKLAKREGNQNLLITLKKSNRTISVKGQDSLLEELEQEGIYPPHGCRMGICHTCICTKTSGEVKNISNGSSVGEEGKTIQLCTNRAETNLELEL